VPVETPEEIPDGGWPDRITICIAFRLNIDTIEPQRVLVDNSIHAAIPTAAKGTSGLGSRSSISHRQEQIYNKSFKEIRERTSDAFEKFLRKRHLNLDMGGSHDLIGCLILSRYRFSCFDSTRGRFCTLSELYEFIESLQEPDVDCLWAFRKHFLSPTRDAEVPSPRWFNQTRFRKIGLGPMNPVRKDGLPSGRQKHRSFLFAQAQTAGKKIDDIADTDFALFCSPKDREHQALKVRHPSGCKVHVSILPMAPSNSTDW
jgi:hypothetical protein